MKIPFMYSDSKTEASSRLQVHMLATSSSLKCRETIVM
jgi:hypothetical protein